MIFPTKLGFLPVFPLLVESPVIIPVTQVRNWGVILDTLIFPVLHLTSQSGWFLYLLFPNPAPPPPTSTPPPSLSSSSNASNRSPLTPLFHHSHPNLVSSPIADISSCHPAEIPRQWLPITFRMPAKILPQDLSLQPRLASFSFGSLSLSRTDLLSIPQLPLALSYLRTFANAWNTLSLPS